MRCTCRHCQWRSGDPAASRGGRHHRHASAVAASSIFTHGSEPIKARFYMQVAGLMSGLLAPDEAESVSECCAHRKSHGSTPVAGQESEADSREANAGATAGTAQTMPVIDEFCVATSRDAADDPSRSRADRRRGVVRGSLRRCTRAGRSCGDRGKGGRPSWDYRRLPARGPAITDARSPVPEGGLRLWSSTSRSALVPIGFDVQGLPRDAL